MDQPTTQAPRTRRFIVANYCPAGIATRAFRDCVCYYALAGGLGVNYFVGGE